MNSIAIVVYSLIVSCTYFSNKFVLTYLGFRFPMVFQGWVTLVGSLILRLLAYIPSKQDPTLRVLPLDRSAFISLLPNFFLFTISIIAGSKALAHLPILTFIAVANVVPAGIYILDNLSLKKTSVVQLISSITVIGSSIPVILAASDDVDEEGKAELSSLMDSPKFWLVVHVFCVYCVSLHGRIADARFGAADRLFYSYIFSLVVLAPASLYLEEAFQALHFQPSRQIDFVLGSLISAFVGVAQNLYAIRLKEDEEFGKLHHASLGFAGLLSIAFFSTDLPWWGWMSCVLNLLALVFVPTFMKKDDNLLGTQSDQQLPHHVT
eukprot:09450.XXX_528956_529997_1 [CDS] Oithona nana genome sequencing.